MRMCRIARVQPGDKFYLRESQYTSSRTFAQVGRRAVLQPLQLDSPFLFLVCTSFRGISGGSQACRSIWPRQFVSARFCLGREN